MKIPQEFLLPKSMLTVGKVRTINFMTICYEPNKFSADLGKNDKD